MVFKPADTLTNSTRSVYNASLVTNKRTIGSFFFLDVKARGGSPLKKMTLAYVTKIEQV